ncbi:MAG: putative protein N(5)-glutamine methyltransferase [bacterium]
MEQRRWPLRAIERRGRGAVVERLRAAGCVFAEEEADLLLAADVDPEQLAVMVERRVAGEPLEHVVGEAEFCGLRIVVSPGVFVPRPRSEFLVERAAGLVGSGSVVVDLCCGSGALGAALAVRRPGIELHASDIDAQAVRCAADNLAAVGGVVHCGDLYVALPARLRGRVDLVVANAPYIPTDAIGLLPPEARDHEPRAALDGGADGLDLHRGIAAESGQWLRAGGYLVIETSAGQAAETAAIMTGCGLSAEIVGDDDLDATVVVGRSRPVE